MQRWVFVVLLAACGGKSVAGGKCAVTSDCTTGLFCSTAHVCTRCPTVSCDSIEITLGGIVSGISGNLVLADGTRTVSISGDGPYQFAGDFGVGESYSISVKTQPAGQQCTVENASGTLNASVSNANVSCTTTYSVSGRVFGLPNGSSISVTNNSANSTTLTPSANSFSFPVNAGAPFAIAIGTSPSGVSCGVVGGQGTATGNVTVTVTCLAPVQPLYVAAPNWLDWVEGATPTDPNSAACSGNEIGWNACVPGGERRSVDLPGITSCAGWSAADTLAAFNWVCQPNGDHVAFSSSGLSETAGLSSLIDFTQTFDGSLNGFLTNQVTITDTTGDTLTTPSSQWWSDPFPAASNCGSGTTPGITVIKAGQCGSGAALTWTAPSVKKIAAVVQPGVSAKLAFLNFGKFAWFEGDFDGSGNTEPTFTALQSFTLFHNVSTHGNFSYAGFDLNSNNLWFRHVRSYSNDVGFNIAGNFDVLHDIIAANNINDGIRLASPKVGNNVFDMIRSYGNGGNGLNFASAGGTDNNANGGDVITDAVLATNDGDGIRCANDGVTVMAATILANNDTGGDEAGLYSIDDGGGDGEQAHLRVISTAVINNENQGIRFDHSNDTFLAGLLLNDPNMVSGSPHDIAMINTTTSVHLPLSYVIDCDSSLEGSFCANFNTSVGNNTHYFGPAVASASETVIRDWTLAYAGTVGSPMSDPFQFWGSGTVSDVATDKLATLPCLSGSCLLWDATLHAASDNPLLSAVSAPDTAPSGVFLHYWDMTAPSATDAPTICTTLGGTYTAGAPPVCASVALLFASEIFGDGIGNDNGLCESNENCLLLQNLGAYQGSGALTLIGAYTANGVSNAQLFTYATNGQ